MEKKFTLPLVILFVLTALTTNAQKKILILGSSTAAGNAANPIDSSWANRLQFLYNKNTSDGIDTTILNLALPGFVTYKAMHTGFPTPPNRLTWPVDPDRNITKALSYSPDVIIISFPSNDVAITPDYDMKETMDNFRSMFQRSWAVNVRCYVTTMQPRNEMDDVRRQQLRQLTDSINNNFGYYAVDFWSPLVTTDGQNNMRPEVNADGIHPNTLGHRYLYQQISAKAIFGPVIAPLPLSLTGFTVSLQNNAAVVKWKTEKESPNTYFEIQKSADGRNFETLKTERARGLVQSAEYSWIDKNLLEYKSYYRLKIIEPLKTSYSKVLSIINKNKQLLIQKLYVNASHLNLDINSRTTQTAVISIVNLNGAILQKQTYHISSQGNKIVINISNLGAGDYIVSVVAADGSRGSGKFTRIK